MILHGMHKEVNLETFCSHLNDREIYREIELNLMRVQWLSVSFAGVFMIHASLRHDALITRLYIIVSQNSTDPALLNQIIPESKSVTLLIEVPCQLRILSTR